MMNNKTLSLAALLHHLAQVKVQILFFACEELLQPFLNTNAQALVCVKKSPLWNSYKSALWLPIPYLTRSKEPPSCCFPREWLYGFKLSFKTPRLHISTLPKIGSLCWRLNQREPSESSHVSWWLHSTQTDNNCPPFIILTPRTAHAGPPKRGFNVQTFGWLPAVHRRNLGFKPYELSCANSSHPSQSESSMDLTAAVPFISWRAARRWCWQGGQDPHVSVNTGFPPACLHLPYSFKYIHACFTTTTVFCFTPSGGQIKPFLR